MPLLRGDMVFNLCAQLLKKADFDLHALHVSINMRVVIGEIFFSDSHLEILGQLHFHYSAGGSALTRLWYLIKVQDLWGCLLLGIVCLEMFIREYHFSLYERSDKQFLDL